MKIAVTYENGNVFQHFGRTEQFKVYEIQDNKIIKEEIIKTVGNGHGALAQFLTDLKVDTVICGGIGAGAQEALTKAGIKFYPGVSGKTDEMVHLLLEDRLPFNPDIKCGHHEHHEHHEEGHQCGEHKHGCTGNK